MLKGHDGNNENTDLAYLFTKGLCCSRDMGLSVSRGLVVRVEVQSIADGFEVELIGEAARTAELSISGGVTSRPSRTPRLPVQ